MPEVASVLEDPEHFLMIQINKKGQSTLEVILASFWKKLWIYFMAYALAFQLHHKLNSLAFHIAVYKVRILLLMFKDYMR